jgi:hydrogenase maturation protease
MHDLSKSPLRLIGIGNLWRGDDGAGIVLAERIRNESLPGLDVILHQGDGASLITLWEGIDRVILVDAVCGQGAAGRLLRFDLNKEILPEDIFPVSTHSLGIPEALQIVKTLHLPLPPSFLLFGITGERFDWGAKPSFDIVALGETFLNRIKGEMADWAQFAQEIRCTKRV